jgi:hypothetical protein
MPTLSLLPKPEKRTGAGADGAIDLVLQSGTRDIDHIAIITTRKNGGGMAWFHNELSNKELVWLMERCKHAILENEQNQKTRV